MRISTTWLLPILMAMAFAGADGVVVLPQAGVWPQQMNASSFADTSRFGVEFSGGPTVISSVFVGATVSAAYDFLGDDSSLNSIAISATKWNDGTTWYVQGRTLSNPWPSGAQSLPSVARLILSGIGEGLCGYRLSPAGDFDGDQLADALISGPSYGPTSSGAIWILYGNEMTATRTTNYLTEYQDGSHGVRVDGPHDYSRLGWYGMQVIGDINHDGCDDFFTVTTPEYSSTRGVAFVLFGGPRGGDFGGSVNLTRWDDIPDRLVRITGKDLVNTQLSDTILKSKRGGEGGDLNQDGIADFVIGDYTDSMSYIFFGTASSNWSEWRDKLVLSKPDISIPVSTDFSDYYWGFQNGIMGDFDGDSIDDMIAAGWYSLSIIFGRDSSSWSSLSGAHVASGDPRRVNIEVTGVINDFTSADVNGDGLMDLIVGLLDSGTSAHGHVTVLFGRPSQSWSHLISLDSMTEDEGFNVMYEEYIDAYFGAVVSGTPDMNGDGIDDLVISASSADSYHGRAFMLFGNKAPTLTLKSSITPATEIHRGEVLALNSLLSVTDNQVLSWTTIFITSITNCWLQNSQGTVVLSFTGESLMSGSVYLVHNDNSTVAPTLTLEPYDGQLSGAAVTLSFTLNQTRISALHCNSFDVYSQICAICVSGYEPFASGCKLSQATIGGTDSGNGLGGTGIGLIVGFIVLAVIVVVAFVAVVVIMLIFRQQKTNNAANHDAAELQIQQQQPGNQTNFMDTQLGEGCQIKEIPPVYSLQQLESSDTGSLPTATATTSVSGFSSPIMYMQPPPMMADQQSPEQQQFAMVALPSGATAAASGGSGSAGVIAAGGGSSDQMMFVPPPVAGLVTVLVET